MKLFLEALIKFLCGLVFVGLQLFLPAGGLNYCFGWLFLALLFGPMLVLGAVLLVKSPDLLRKRLDSREQQAAQKGVVALSGLLFLSGFIVAGFDFRFGWSQMPTAVTVAASVVLLIAYALYAEVMRENAYLSRTVKVDAGQTVIDSGLYGIVRHPMYAATVCLFLAIPLVLGSWWSLLCFSPYPVVIAVRIIGEEELLTAELPGYAAYCQKVRYRLIPFIW